MKTSIDPIWEKIHSVKLWGQYPTEHVIRFVARNFYSKNRHDIKILDFCCGGGAHSWYLAREGFDVYAFDGSESAVKNTRRKLEQEGLSANLSVCDAANLSYPDDFFDAVIDNVSIDANRLDDIKTMYKAIYRILNPNGKLLTVCFDKETTGFGTGKEIEPDTFTDMTSGVLKTSGVHHFFDKQSINALLAEIGFTGIKNETLVYTDNGNVISEIITMAEKE